MQCEPFMLSFSELFNLSFQEVSSLNPFQVSTLAQRKIRENEYIQMILVKAEESLGSGYRLRIPDPFAHIHKYKPIEQYLFDPLSYMEKNKRILVNSWRVGNSGMDNEFRKVKARKRMYEKIEELNSPLSNVIKKQSVFLQDIVATCYDELVIKKRPMPLFMLANLEALLRILEMNFSNGQFHSFGLYEQQKEKYDLFGLYEMEARRTAILIVLIKQVITKIYSVWEINQKEFDTFQIEYQDLFCYPTDLIPITYISSSYLSTIKGSSFDSPWEWVIDSNWGWDDGLLALSTNGNDEWG